jgi:multimeric flavodoxin WrbA
MAKVLAINGSPRMDKGNTALLLNSFLQGITDAGSIVDLYYTSQLSIKPCSCGNLYCWNNRPGECCFKDDMDLLYPKLKAADILVLATPVYIPLPGEMQNFINRLCPLLDPTLVERTGRTRARFRNDIKIRKFVLVATSGWWEIENMDTVVQIVRELAEDASAEFSGALLRPHASEMWHQGVISADGQTTLDAAEQTGRELIEQGRMHPETLKLVSRPLVVRELYY